MSLSSVTGGKQSKPEKILLYGVEGIGKSSFAAGAPGALFMDVELGTKHLNVKRFNPLDESGNPLPLTWQDIMDGLHLLGSQPHNYKTLVVDTLDRAEALLWSHITERDHKENIEAYGYGKGYQAAIDEWRIFAAALDHLVTRCGMNVILVAHSWIKTFKNPIGDDFDRYQMKLHDKAAGFLREWADHVFFAAYEEFAVKRDAKDKTQKAKGISTGKRLVFTTKSAAYDAKHRGELPDSMLIEWPAFAEANKANAPMSAAELRTAIETHAQKLPEKERGDAIGALGRAADDVAKLETLRRWVTDKLAEIAAVTTTVAP